MSGDRPKRRSLMLAGGGMKVAFQAGVLQVWLDEAGLRFDHVDACSGGAFNLAMLCQGYSGLRIADAWRRTDPRDGISVRPGDLVRFPYGRSLVDLRKYRDRVFPGWGLDEERIRASDVTATFSAYDVDRARLRTFSAAEFTIDVLCACVSLPVWFLPVELPDGLYADAVFATDANIQAALDAGADEIWIVWTVSTRPEWFPGPMAQYFHALESAANGHLEQDLARIAANNAIVDARGAAASPLGRRVDVVPLKAEVPVHYLAVLGLDRLHRAVERGVAEARRWCDSRGIRLRPVESTVHHDDGARLAFRDTFRGRMVRAVEDPRRRRDVAFVDADLCLVIDDVGLFATDPTHRADLLGTVTSDLFVGRVAGVVGGEAHVFRDDGRDPTRKQMRYRVLLRDEGGRPFTLIGVKRVESGQLSRLWSETTTPHSRIVEGHAGAGGATGHRLVAAGDLRMSPTDVLRQIAAVDVDAPRLTGRIRGVARFGAAFVGNLWDVYARRALSYGPF